MKSPTYDRVPKAHPFRTFLENLPDNAACDPRPDWIESANTSRFAAAFSGINASARLAMFHNIVKERQPGITIMTQRAGDRSAQMVFFLNNIEAYKPSETTLALMEPDSEFLGPPEPSITGIKEMLSY